MKNKTIKICITSLMSAMVLVSTFIRIPIPIGEMTTMIHLGNVFCILSALLLGPIYGGIASGLGSFIFDLVNPGYVAFAPITFLLKFIMGFVCGTIARKSEKQSTVFFAAFMGSMSYITLHAVKNFLKNMFVLTIPINANLIIISKGTAVSCINGIIAVAIAVPMFKVIKKALKNIDIK